MNKDIVLIDKHKGITSFDVIRIVRKLIGIRKIGHAGTLDPNATGLMILGIGKGTKQLNTFIKLPKVYVAEILLGIKTDSGDIDGVIVEKKKINKLDMSDVKKTVVSLVGNNMLPVPIYSAVKKKGKRLFKYAREGKDVELPNKEMRVLNAKLLNYNHPLVTVKFDVSSGTYIRSLAEEFGKQLDTIATLNNLRRTSIDTFTIENAWKIETQKQQEAFAVWYKG